MEDVQFYENVDPMQIIQNKARIMLSHTITVLEKMSQMLILFSVLAVFSTVIMYKAHQIENHVIHLTTRLEKIKSELRSEEFYCQQSDMEKLKDEVRKINEAIFIISKEMEKAGDTFRSITYSISQTNSEVTKKVEKLNEEFISTQKKEFETKNELFRKISDLKAAATSLMRQKSQIEKSAARNEVINALIGVE